MGNETTSEPVRVLTDYSQKRAGPNEVMRALASHKGWLAPVTGARLHRRGLEGCFCGDGRVQAVVGRWPRLTASIIDVAGRVLQREQKLP
jgi:hypothetical protein